MHRQEHSGMLLYQNAKHCTKVVYGSPFSNTVLMHLFECCTDARASVGLRCSPAVCTLCTPGADTTEQRESLQRPHNAVYRRLFRGTTAVRITRARPARVVLSIAST